MIRGGDVRIGDLRQRVGIERVVRVTDGGGGAEEEWDMVAEVWAAVMPLTGTERVEADAVNGNVSHEIWMRYRPDVAPDMRLRLGPRLFDVRAVMDVEERRRFLRCLCEERDL
ncbi:phage head closure protein [Filomicrobium sp.]|uniref:phage head closure protein n=1 Tax=Filomicrobium sp. TaxID=2024831 RepID=UPI00258AF5E2|nr:phage head closure protein [Filomicrobium sp.]MCV0370821.1 phage head closure protein [Filomicrobium sp.]